MASRLLVGGDPPSIVTPLTIAVVSTYYRPVLGGAEAAAERLAAFLVRRGHRVVVLTKRTSTTVPSRELLDGVDVNRLDPIGERSSLGKWRFLPAVYRALIARTHDIDVVCCVDYRGIGLSALAARRRTHQPVVFQAQTDGVLSGARVRGWLDRLGMNPAGPTARLATWPIRAAASAVCWRSGLAAIRGSNCQERWRRIPTAGDK
jgi:hypothetical protein